MSQWKLKGATVFVDGKPILRVCRDDKATNAEAAREMKRAETAVNSHDDLVLAAKDACIFISEIAKASGINVIESPTFQRLMLSLAKSGVKP